jgi:hypothetical protein
MKVIHIEGSYSKQCSECSYYGKDMFSLQVGSVGTFLCSFCVQNLSDQLKMMLSASEQEEKVKYATVISDNDKNGQRGKIVAELSSGMVGLLFEDKPSEGPFYFSEKEIERE